MPGWFSKKFDKWAAGKHHEELSSWTAMLRAADGPELGLVVARATDFRNMMEAEGHLLSDPIRFASTNPRFIFSLSTTIQRLQKAKRPGDAVGLMVWVHTLRAAARPELRQLGRDMWRELARGFPYLEKSAEGYTQLTGTLLDTSGAKRFPEGMSPDPK